MITSLALILLIGVILYYALKFIKLPPLIGYLIAGVVIGPFVLNLLDQKLLDISTEIRQIALIIILIRAGLSLNIKDLKKIGRPAILMCFLPAVCELLLVFFLAPLFFDISNIDALILGSVIAAVSPAVVVPRMIKMQQENIGTEKGIPNLIMAGASVDDVLIIILFSSFLSIGTGGNITAMTYLNIPISILLGAGVGIGVGFLIALLFAKTNMPTIFKVITTIGTAFALKGIEVLLEPYIAFSSLLAIMILGITILARHEKSAESIKPPLEKMWIVAEMFLFVLVGASLDITHFANSSLLAVALILCGVAVRMIAVFICTIRTPLLYKERLFCAIAYTPKATVQAAIGGIPLALGLASGNLILSIAVMSILITAPLGAIATDLTHKRLLQPRPKTKI